MLFGSLFSGVGLLDYGLHCAGVRHAWFCESDEWRRGILRGRWPGVPVYDNVRAVGAGTACRVDGVVGGFPCKGVSNAGKREGMGHPETVLWREMRRVVCELEPRWVVVENVAAILSLHGGAVWAEVVGDLATLGFDIRWDVFPAAAFGAPHLRERVIAIAWHPDRAGLEGTGIRGSVADRPCVASESEGESGQRARSGREALERTAPNGSSASTDSAHVGPERAGGARVGRSGSPDRDATPADARVGGCEQFKERHGASPGSRVELQARDEPKRRDVQVEWGAYGPAIQRWEAVHGPAPAPLTQLRGMDDGSAARVVRSRLSALGDGVQVQLGLMVGGFLMGQVNR